jgi:hypothetical protein
MLALKQVLENERWKQALSQHQKMFHPIPSPYRALVKLKTILIRSGDTTPSSSMEVISSKVKLDVPSRNIALTCGCGSGVIIEKDGE